MNNLNNIFTVLARKRGPEAGSSSQANIPLRDDPSQAGGGSRRELALPSGIEHEVIEHIGQMTGRPLSPPPARMLDLPLNHSLRDDPAAPASGFAPTRTLAEPPPPPEQVRRELAMPQPELSAETQRLIDRDTLDLRGMAEEAAMSRRELAPPRDPVRVEAERNSSSLRRYNRNEERMPSESDYTKEHSVRGKGIGARILSGFKTAGKVLLGSGLNPLAAVAGGVTALADPEAEARYTYRTLVAPRHVAQQRELLDRAGKESGIYDKVEDNRRMEDRYDQVARDTAERLRQADERMRQAESRAQTSERHRRIMEIQAAARIPGRRFSTETKAELQTLLGVTLPDEYNPMEYDVQPGAGGNLQLIKINKGAGTATASPVLDASGQPVQGPPRATDIQTQREDAEAQAIDEWMRDNGVKSLSDRIPNPDFQIAFQREKASAAAAAKRYGTPPPTDDEIRSKVAKKVKEFIRADELISSPEIKRRAARIRQQQGGSKKRTLSPPSSSGRDAAMKTDEAEYQQLYPRLSPDARKKLEDAFERDYGRRPNPPGAK